MARVKQLAPLPFLFPILLLALPLILLPGCNREPAASPGGAAVPAVVVQDDALRPVDDADQQLGLNARRALLAAARAACDGQPYTGDAPSALRDFRKRIIVHAFGADGRHAGRVSIDGDEDALAKVAARVPGLCKTRGAELYLHVMPVTFSTRLANFGITGIFDYRVFEPQVMGLIYEVGDKRAERDPLQQVMANLSPKSLRARLAKAVGLDPKEAPSDNRLIYEIYRVQHFAERYPDRAFGDFYRGFEVVSADALTTAMLGERLKLIGEWYRNNVIDGQVTYKYHPSKRRYIDDERTMVRSTMATWVLNRLAVFLDDDDLRAKGLEVVRHYFERYFQMAESLEAGRIIASTEPLANGNVVRDRYTVASFIAAALLERDDWQTYAREIELLMTYAMSFKRPDHVMWTPFGQGQFFMPGQLLLGVAYAYEKTKDTRYKVFFEQVWGTYSGMLSDMMQLAHGRTTPYAPAWYTQPSKAMWDVTGEAAYRDFIFAINDRVKLHYAMNADHQVHPDWDGILTPKAIGWGNNSITAAALESLADAAIVAKKTGDTARLEAYRKPLRATVAYLLRLQFTPANTYFIQQRDRAVGGFKTDLLDHRIWMDNVWHLTSAFIKIHEAGLLD